MYVERRGSGSSTVVLVSNLDAADLWNREEQPPPKVFPEVSGASIYRDVPITVAPDIPGD